MTIELTEEEAGIIISALEIALNQWADDYEELADYKEEYDDEVQGLDEIDDTIDTANALLATLSTSCGDDADD